jgi:hypothetical protein
MRARTGLTFMVLATLCRLGVAEEAGFTPLLKGDDLSVFQLVGIGPDTMKIQDGVIHITGKPNGYFATKEGYKNYVVKFDWMYERPEGLEPGARFDGNSGLLVHIVEPHKVWPRSIEVQLANSDAGNIFAIAGKFQGKKDPAAQKKAIKPVGEWNEEEVTCKDGSIVCKINGVEVARGTGAQPDQGQIGWQSEGRPIRFRNLRIKTLD